MANALTGVPVLALTASFQTVYTVPVGKKFTVSVIHLCNTTGAPVAVRACLVPSAGSPTSNNALAWDYGVAAVPGGGILEFGRGLIFNAGDILQALGAGVSMQLSGIESTI